MLVVPWFTEYNLLLSQYTRMFTMKKLALGTLMAVFGVAQAGTMGPVADGRSAYIKIGAGGSSSMNINVSADPLYWDAAPQGYNNDFRSSALYSAAAGYHFSPLISLDVEFIYRPTFSYQQFQTSMAAGTFGFLGTKTRYFQFESNSIMANVSLHGQGFSPNLAWHMGGFLLQPFISGGIGVSYNTVSDFHSFLPDGTAASMALDRTVAAFAWQLSAGLELLSWRNFELAAGYRYYNGGNFQSNIFTIDDPSYNTPWTGTFQANEGFVTITYDFNA